MRSVLSSSMLTGLVAFLSLSFLPLKQVAAQDDPRGMRVQQVTPTERRVALVIGNSAYKDSLLLNPVNDARDLAAALREFGFEVIFGENLSLEQMERNIKVFGEKIRNGGVGLFYYAGHGIQVRGSNYLIPVDATINIEEEIKYRSVDVGLVLAQMEDARNRLNIVILDACRNNPFARSFRSMQNGLASIDAPSGTLIAYATAPGSVASDGAGRNGLYTRELLKYMKQPDLSIEQLFKQVRVSVLNLTQGRQTPWESSSLVGDFYFLDSRKAANSVATLSGTGGSSKPVTPSSFPFRFSSPVDDVFSTRGVFEGTYRSHLDSIEINLDRAIIKFSHPTESQLKRREHGLLAFISIGLATSYQAKNWTIVSSSQQVVINQIWKPYEQTTLNDLYFSIPIKSAADLSKQWLVVQLEFQYPDGKKARIYIHNDNGLFSRR